MSTLNNFLRTLPAPSPGDTILREALLHWFLASPLRLFIAGLAPRDVVPSFLGPFATTGAFLKALAALADTFCAFLHSDWWPRHSKRPDHDAPLPDASLPAPAAPDPFCQLCMSDPRVHHCTCPPTLKAATFYGLGLYSLLHSMAIHGHTTAPYNVPPPPHSQLPFSISPDLLQLIEGAWAPLFP
jgi:hypothetical protein